MSQCIANRNYDSRNIWLTSNQRNHQLQNIDVCDVKTNTKIHVQTCLQNRLQYDYRKNIEVCTAKTSMPPPIFHGSVETFII